MILTRDSVIKYLGEITLAPITSTIRDIPSEDYPGKQDGMPHDCAINFDHIQTVSKARIEPQITKLSRDKLAQV